MANSPQGLMKGRKRFLADFGAMQEAVKEGFYSGDLKIERLRAGDEEGSIECAVVKPEGKHLASLHCIVSDTSDYPIDHTFFCFSPDQDLPTAVLSALQDVSDAGSCTIEGLFKRLLPKMSPGKAVVEVDYQDEDEDEDEDYDDGEFYAYDAHSDDEFGMTMTNAPATDVRALQGDFNESVACEYRPGIIQFGKGSFALSISVPVVLLAKDIPARALMAWDRQLLTRSHHLTLLISGLCGVYPVLLKDGTLAREAMAKGVALQFRIGLTEHHKPTKEDAAELIRVFGLKENRIEELTPQPVLPDLDNMTDDANDPWADDMQPIEEKEDEAEPETAGFQPFSLSSSLESLMNNYFLKLVQLRLRYGLSWASAELLCWEEERLQQPASELVRSERQRLVEADEEERMLGRSYTLPPDPLLSSSEREHLNVPLLAFCYLIRRLTLCARYCIVCHSKLNNDYEALKPYVCDSKLCTYQYYYLNRGPSLEYEICANPVTVDLLVSLAYAAAADGVLDDPLPIGMGLRVPVPGQRSTAPDGLHDFDGMARPQMCAAVTNLIESLPKIKDIKRYLQKSTGGRVAKPKLKDMDPNVPDAAWSILRWCVASCTAHIEELKSEDERVHNVSSSWRQFRFSVGAPDAEAKYRKALAEVQDVSENARSYPSLYAFHGSPLNNWHSIIRHGLWFKKVTHGRAYGHGVYFAKEGTVSMSGYTGGGSRVWHNSGVQPIKCVALAELVNQPSQFVSTNPYFVVANIDWILCRYLLVNTASDPTPQYAHLGMNANDSVHPIVAPAGIPMVPLDPAHSTTLLNQPIMIPQPSFKLDNLLQARRGEFADALYDEDDRAIFCADDHVGSQSRSQDVDTEMTQVEDDWQHDSGWVSATVGQLMPPPEDSTPMATMALQKELKAMLREQEKAKSLKELGWYMPTDFIGDNLFQWIVELHSFDESLPVAKDMADRGVNSLIFEIRFPPNYPHSPPFFRILKPRFLPFIHGGGGHITGGGSMCMDLLTADGWLPSYSISAVLLQIKLAISNLDPRPARLAQNWDAPYGMQEAIDGYKRAAATHGWKIPQGLERLGR